MKKFLIALLFVPALALFAPALVLASGPSIHLDKAPDKRNDQAALQNGAKLFVNYCLNCHSASYMRYNRLKEIGLTDAQIKDNLLFTADKVGEPMRIAMQRNDARKWFGTAPPDLTLIARSRASADGSGADWLYTYLRSFYRDDSRPTGWNNRVFENVGMPHALWELQGIRTLKTTAVHPVMDAKDGSKVASYERVTTQFGADGAKTVNVEKLEGLKHRVTTRHAWGDGVPGAMNAADYDSNVADLVAFLQYMAEPGSENRKHLGVIVIVFLLVLLVFAYALKREFWKDLH